MLGNAMEMYGDSVGMHGNAVEVLGNAVGMLGNAMRCWVMLCNAGQCRGAPGDAGGC